METIKLQDVNDERISKALFDFCNLHNVSVGNNIELVIQYLKNNKGSMYISSFERLLERYPDNSTINCSRTLQGHFFSRLIDEFFKNNRMAGVDDKVDEDNHLYIDEDGLDRPIEQQEQLYKEKYPDKYREIMNNGFKKTYDQYLCSFKGKRGSGLWTLMGLVSLYDYLISIGRLTVDEFTNDEINAKTEELKKWDEWHRSKLKDKHGLPIDGNFQNLHTNHEWGKASFVALKFDKEFNNQ